jgi:AraC-like DNA-binding protein
MQHSEIKTYRATEPFALKTMEEIFLVSGGAPDQPHRHDYYTLILIEKGEGTHVIDFKEYNVTNNSIYFILPGQMHQLSLSETPQGWTILFTEEFLVQNAITHKLINDIYLYHDYGESPPLAVGENDIELYIRIIEQMNHYRHAINNFKWEALGSLLKLLLIQSNNNCSLHKPDNPQMMEAGNLLLRNFKKLIEQNYHSHHKVNDYADLLFVTADYLNKTVKALTGKSAKEHIQSKLITEAKRSLLFTNLSNKELAFNLGFEEAAHFNNFFKKLTNQTPTEFRTSTFHS